MNEDTKLDTLQLAAETLAKASAPLDLHKRIAQDLTDIAVIVEEWKKVKETKVDDVN